MNETRQNKLYLWSRQKERLISTASDEIECLCMTLVGMDKLIASTENPTMKSELKFQRVSYIEKSLDELSKIRAQLISLQEKQRHLATNVAEPVAQNIDEFLTIPTAIPVSMNNPTNRAFDTGPTYNMLQFDDADSDTTVDEQVL